MRARGTVLVLLGTVAVGAVVLLQGAPILAKRKLIAVVQAGCDGCAFDVDRVQFHPTSREVVVEGIRYHGNPNDFVEVSFEIERLEAHIGLRPLFHQTWTFAQVVVVKPTFQVIEKDPKPQSPPSPETFPRNLPPLAIAAMAVSDGAVTYIHRARGQDAVIQVSQIKGTAANFSSRPGLGSSNTTFDVSGQLERSGKCQIHAHFDLLAAKNDDHLQIDLQQLALRDMDPYFFKNDGVRVDGVLETAKATMAIRRGMLTGDLAARYRDLVVHYSRTQDRSATGAFFSEALQKILIQKMQGQQTPTGARFQVARKPDESIVKFMISGLKPAVHDILTARAVAVGTVKSDKRNKPTKKDQ